MCVRPDLESANSSRESTSSNLDRMCCAVMCCATLRSYPWKLLQLVDARITSEKKDSLINEFVKAPSCELDSWFSLPLRERLHGPSGMNKIISLLQAVADFGRATNMPLENKLSEIKAAAACGHGSPSAERVAWAGALTHMMKRHVKSGRQDRRGKRTYQQLVKDGVPIRANPCTRKRKTGSARPHILRTNIKLKTWRAQNKGASLLEVNAARHAFAAEWQRLTEVAKAEFVKDPLMDADGAVGAVDAPGVSPWQQRVGDEAPPLLEAVLPGGDSEICDSCLL